MTTIVKKTQLKKVRGYDDFKIHYLLKHENGELYSALYWNLLGKPVVYDVIYDTHILQNEWFINLSTGYVANKNKKYMHCFIMNISQTQDTMDPNLSVDHINCCKLDNRVKNLRLATQSEQNANRQTRSDKLPPCEELQNIGVVELPRYVRWDRTEKKFVIEKHPQLLKEVKEGVRKKAIMSGSKSKTLTVMAKYQDIIARLKDLDEKSWSADNVEFQRIKNRNRKEYEDICKCIEVYEGRCTEIDIVTKNQTEDIQPVKRTCAGKKTISNLPDDCGVKHEDLPKYCYYKPKTDKRGDCFTIDKHPTLIAKGKRQWSTTQMYNISTLEKYNQLMQKYVELQSSCI